MVAALHLGYYLCLYHSRRAWCYAPLLKVRVKLLVRKAHACLSLLNANLVDGVLKFAAFEVHLEVVVYLGALATVVCLAPLKGQGCLRSKVLVERYVSNRRLYAHLVVDARYCRAQVVRAARRQEAGSNRQYA